MIQKTKEHEIHLFGPTEINGSQMLLLDKLGYSAYFDVQQGITYVYK